MVVSNDFYGTLSIFYNRFLELFFALSRDTDILWIVAPLLIATVIMFIYFQKHREEQFVWGSAVSNSLVSLFVSVSLLRYIYFLGGSGNILNLSENLSRTIFSLVLFFMAFLLLIFNFGHILPKRVAYHLSSPLTINLVSYLAIIFVYSTMPFDIITFLVLLVFFVLMRLILYIFQFPLVKFFKYLTKIKDMEEIEDVKKEKKKIKEEKRKIKKKEVKLKKTRLKNVKNKGRKVKRLRKAISKR